MSEYLEGVIYRYEGFGCGRLYGDGCEAWIEDSVMVTFEGVVYINGRLLAMYKIIEPHVCSVCGKVSNTVYKSYGMNEADEDAQIEKIDAIIDNTFDRMGRERKE